MLKQERIKELEKKYKSNKIIYCENYDNIFHQHIG